MKLTSISVTLITASFALGFVSESQAGGILGGAANRLKKSVSKRVSIPKLPSIPSVPDFSGGGFPGVELPDPRKIINSQTNRARVNASITNGWRTGTAFVIFGQEIDHQRQKGMAEAIGASIVAENPAPAMAYLKLMAYEQKMAFQRNVHHEGRRVVQQLSQQFLENAFKDAVAGNFRRYQIDGAEIEVGIAIYNHSKRIVIDYPEINGPRGTISWSRDERVIPLPNSFCPYVRARLNVSEHQSIAMTQYRAWNGAMYTKLPNGNWECRNQGARICFRENMKNADGVVLQGNLQINGVNVHATVFITANGKGKITYSAQGMRSEDQIVGQWIR